MSRFPQKQATHGSQFRLQRFVSERASLLDDAIGLGPLEWRSPLPQDEFAEYRDVAFLHALGLPDEVTLGEFWPHGGPQWDGLAVAASGELVLIEAKSHAAEMASSCAASAPASLGLITTSLESCKRALGADPSSDWLHGYYQFANRLAHAWYLNESLGVPAVLAFVYFVGDTTMPSPLSHEGWRAAITAAHVALGLASLPSYVREVFVDV